MDQFLLHAVATEAAGRLVEQELLRVAFLGHSRYLFRFATSARDNLLVSIRPDLPRLHLTPRKGRFLELAPDRFAAWLDQELAGATLTAITKRPWDRVVELRFRLPRRVDGVTERRLVVELFGRSANILVLDSAGIVLAYARHLKNSFRNPRAGEPYQAPDRPLEYAQLPSEPSALPAIRAGWADEAAFLESLSPLLARDLRRAETRGEARAGDRLREILQSVESGVWRPTLYAVRPPEELTEGDRLGRDDLVVSPLPLLASIGDTDPRVVEFSSPSEAAQVGFDTRERLHDFLALREHHSVRVRKETARLSVLVAKLEAELAAARDADLYRRFGEALLAGFTVARIEGARVMVPDPADPDAAPLTIPIDPARTLQENAQGLFGRYKKGKRAVATIEARMAAARARLADWRELGGRAASIRTPEEIESLQEAMGRLGLVHPRTRRRSSSPAPARELPTRVRQHTSPDGLQILVGKSGAENDSLTFRVAAPWDFWLHAAGFPGAHVVVRNPKRLKSLPDATLRRAAEIAAFYSGARTDGAVEVHFTQRKHVRKRKGMPPGQVLVKRFRSILVVPRLPGPSHQDV